MTSRAYVCEFCGDPASVHIMHDVGRPGSARHFCLHCADGLDSEDRHVDSLRHGTVVIVVGFFLLTLSILADWLRLGHGSGFGPWQATALALAVVIISSGSLIRVSSLSVLGLCLLGVTLAADYLGLDGREGFGIRQTTGLVVGCLAIGAGVGLGLFTKYAGRPAP